MRFCFCFFIFASWGVNRLDRLSIEQNQWLPSKGGGCFNRPLIEQPKGRAQDSQICLAQPICANPSCSPALPLCRCSASLRLERGVGSFACRWPGMLWAPDERKKIMVDKWGLLPQQLSISLLHGGQGQCGLRIHDYTFFPAKMTLTWEPGMMWTKD